MSNDGADVHDGAPLARDTESEIKEMLGLFDAPAFVRRGHDLEYALARLRQRLTQERAGLLDMVRLRLRQWASVSTGPDDWSGAFTAPIEPLWDLAGPVTTVWAHDPGPARRRRAVARDLAASVERFNRRWADFLHRLTLDRVNVQIDQYNRYYVLEKECVLGSARLAAQHFRPKPLMSPESLLAELPILPVPGLVEP